ncbi:MAG: TIGR04282 family arsenosugar biosynthesis glycosyltransferase [Calditrichia bacterium]
MNKNALIIFMKAPRAGRVKTRLQPQITTAQSLALYRAMGNDLLSHFKTAQDFDLFIYFWPPATREEMQNWLGRDLNFFPQKEGDLGEKMCTAFDNLFDMGYLRGCIIGSDLPFLTTTDIRSAFAALDSSDVVLGPTFDGGYYLIALKKNHPVLFHEVDWSSERVWPQTLEKAQESGLMVFELDKKRDIDTYEDLQTLRQQLNDVNGSKLKKKIPNTGRVISEIFSTTPGDE